MGDVDLFQAASAEGAWTVSQVARRARQVVEQGVGLLWVTGEVSGFKAYSSGHWYFALRDRSAQLRCVMWRRDNRRLPTSPADGMQVYCLAQPTVWEERGEFRLTVRELLSTAAGGLWQLALERARTALERDGLLDPARKRPLPRFPTRVAVVTSKDGAALHDVLKVLRERWPLTEVVVVPTVVQGDDAPTALVTALARLNALEGIDVAIVGRGGGAREDLWAFNLEPVARALAEVKVPTICAVGHESDRSLCDLVADHSAPTPSAAAAVAVPDQRDVTATLAALGRRAGFGLERRLRLHAEGLGRAGDRLGALMARSITGRRASLAQLGARLDALSPLRVLDRGYAVARDEAGRVLSRVADLPAGQRFRVRVRDGEVGAVSEGVR